LTTLEKLTQVIENKVDKSDFRMALGERMARSRERSVGDDVDVRY